MRSRRRRPEAALQKAVVEFLYAALPEEVFWTAINPNPTKGVVAGAIAKAMGQRAGVADLLLVHKGRAYFIELKAPKGRISPAQRAFECAIYAAQGRAIVCQSIGEVAMALAEWNIPCRARPVMAA